MSKRLAGWMAWTFLVWAGFAQALGLGEIESRSRLNQQVAASIPILSASVAELDSIAVQLASNEDFERAGVERGEFLSSLRFSVENGVIRVSSKQIAREPFVSFLLDVRWDGGRLLREYTLLLDPPALAGGTGISAPQAAPIGEAMTPTIPEGPADYPSEATAATEPAMEPATEEPGAEPAPPPDAPAEMAAGAAEAPAGASAEGGSYGPVAPQETLWSIAYKLRPDPATITMDQMQVAIFNANPKAFHGGSIRGLMKGAMLRIPGADEVRAVDAASAKALVAEAREGGAATAAAPRPEPAPAPVEEAPAELPPPAPPEPEATTAQATPPPPTPEAAPPSEAAPAGAPPASEEAPAPAVEAPPAAAEPAPAPPETQAAAPPKPARVAKPSLVDTLLDTAKGVVESAKGAFEDPMVQYAAGGLVALIILAFVGKKAADKLAQMRYNRASKQVEAARTAPSAAVGSEDVTQVAEPPEPSMQQALDSAHDAAAAGAAGNLSATVTMGADTMQQTMQQTQVQEPQQASTGGRGVDFDVTSNFASETVQINLDAGDPLSEAEFHRAYGLYDEAALMLKQALQKDPNRTEARVKLAEIYFEAGKANEFVEVAKELKTQLPPDKWQPIALMGSQIAPANDLFSGAGAGAGTVDLSFDEPAMPAAPAAAPAAPAAAASDALEFDLGSLSLDTGSAAPAAEPAAAPAAPAAPAGDALEFDLGNLVTETPAAPAAEAPAAAPPGEPAAGDLSLDLGDFDLNAGAEAAPASGGEVVELASEPMAEPVADEAGTKLDLARAYLDMGDADMAKSLLNEVAQQGNDAQKKEAEELLQRASA